MAEEYIGMESDHSPDEIGIVVPLRRDLFEVFKAALEREGLKPGATIRTWITVYIKSEPAVDQAPMKATLKKDLVFLRR